MTMQQDATLHIRQLLRTAESEHGTKPEQALAQLGLTPELIAEPLAPFSVAVAEDLTVALIASTGDTRLGLKAGVLTDLRRDIPMASGWLAAAESPLEALQRQAVLLRAVSNTIEVVVVEREREVAVVFNCPGDLTPYRRQLIDLVVGMTAGPAQCAALGVSPLRVELPHSARDLEVYCELLGCPVELGASAARVVFDRKAVAPVERAPKAAELELDSALGRHLAGLPKLSDPSELLTYRLSCHLARNHSVPSLAQVGLELGWRPRTMQERLRRQGTTWRGVVDDVLCSLTEKWLAEGVTMAKVAKRLGFSEPSALRRARRRWRRSLAQNQAA